MITIEKQNSTKNLSNNFNTVQDIFTPSEASDMLLSVIESKLNFYKLQYMSNWEGNHSETEANGKDKIKALEKQKNQLKQLIMQARFDGCNLKINNSLEISSEK